MRAHQAQDALAAGVEVVQTSEARPDLAMAVGPCLSGKDAVGERLSREAAAPYAARRSVQPSIFSLARRLYDAGWSPVFRSRYRNCAQPGVYALQAIGLL